MKLTGKAMRGMFADMGKESLYKRMERLQKEDEESPSVHAALRELLALFPDAPFSRDLKAALEGDAAAMDKMRAMTPWEAYLHWKLAIPGEKLSPRETFILEIERACQEPARLVQQLQFVDAATMLSTHPVMREFLWPQALGIFQQARQPQVLRPLRTSVALEIQLSLVALVDVSVALEAGDPTNSHFSCLIPSEAESDVNPTTLFFRWLKKEVGAKKIDELLTNGQSDTGDVMNSTTLKRWSNGSHQPDPVWLRLLAKDLFGNADYEPLWNRYWASRHLNFIGYLAETLRERIAQLEESETLSALAPWPKLPYNCDSITAWFSSRYPVWLAYHRRRLADQE